MKEIKFRLQYSKKQGRFFLNRDNHPTESWEDWKIIADNITENDFTHFIIFLGYNVSELPWDFYFDYSHKYMQLQWGLFKKYKKVLAESGYKLQVVKKKKKIKIPKVDKTELKPLISNNEKRKTEKKSKMDGLVDKLRQRKSTGKSSLWSQLMKEIGEDNDI